MKVVVIGGGPAGLRAAEVAAGGGAQVTLVEAKPSVGRKFLVAGKGGLNLTHSEDFESFIRRYSGPCQPDGFWERVIRAFDPAALRAWAAGLGETTFRASSGRVYPTSLKAAPLLRGWIHHLRELGVEFHTRQRLTDIRAGQPLTLLTTGEAGTHEHACDAAILALGGASWPTTGSDGGWVRLLEELGIAVRPLTAANCGWEADWPAAVLETAEGQPLKNLSVTAGGQTAIGELIVTRYGLEGGPVYQLGPALRAMAKPVLEIDFKPTFTAAELIRKMESVRRDFLGAAQVRWKLSPAASAIVDHLHGPFADAASLATAVKSCHVWLRGPRPVAEAISSAGGVCWSELDDSLMLRKLPGVFLAGEMIDWEAPTGGFLMQGCFATGTHAARGALKFAAGPPGPDSPAS